MRPTETILNRCQMQLTKCDVCLHGLRRVKAIPLMSWYHGPGVVPNTVRGSYLSGGQIPAAEYCPVPLTVRPNCACRIPSGEMNTVGEHRPDTGSRIRSGGQIPAPEYCPGPYSAADNCSPHISSTDHILGRNAGVPQDKYGMTAEYCPALFKKSEHGLGLFIIRFPLH